MADSAIVDAADFPISAGMRDDLARAQYFVKFWFGFVEVRSSSETVDKSRFAARAVSVGEEMEHLQTAGVGEVCCVSMDRES